MINKLLAVFIIWAFAGTCNAEIADYTDSNHGTDSTNNTKTTDDDTTTNTPGVPKLKFSFFISSMSVATQQFITTKFAPIYDDLKSFFDVEFILWGKSKRNKNGKVHCQHGIKECRGNTIMSCALDKMKGDQAKQVEYIICEMTYNYAVDSNLMCVNSSGVDEPTVEECYTSSEGDRLQRVAETMTKKIGYRFFEPAYALNNFYNAHNQAFVFKNFRLYVCGLLKKYNPVACEEHGR